MKSVANLGSKHFDMKNNYYLLTADGTIDQQIDKLIRHTRRDASAQKIKFVQTVYTGTIKQGKHTLSWTDESDRTIFVFETELADIRPTLTLPYPLSE